MIPAKYIAILGFATQANHHQISLVKELVRKIGEMGYGISVGNLSGIFEHALQSAISERVSTLAIVEKKDCLLEMSNCDVLLIAATQQAKHIDISNKSVGGIIIGGGPGTLKLAECFLNLGKPIVAIADSGGVVTSELPEGVHLSRSTDLALDTLIQACA